MQQIRFVEAEKLESIEDYAAALTYGALTIRTLQMFHVNALHKGLLMEDEQELAKTIHWELTRLMNLYSTQLNNVLGRTEITQEMIIDSLKGIVPEIKKKRSNVPKKDK